MPLHISPILHCITRQQGKLHPHAEGARQCWNTVTNNTLRITNKVYKGKREEEKGNERKGLADKKDADLLRYLE